METAGGEAAEEEEPGTAATDDGLGLARAVAGVDADVVGGAGDTWQTVETEGHEARLEPRREGRPDRDRRRRPAPAAASAAVAAEEPIEDTRLTNGAAAV